MSTPDGDNTFLHELERGVRSELTLAEASQSEQIVDSPIDEWLFDPTDVQREEIGLRSLLRAVEAVEGGVGAASHPHGIDVAARGHCLSAVRAVDRLTGAARYGCMFPGLDPLGTDTRLLMRAGGSGGVCDAAAVLDRLGPEDDATESAGWPFFGQLIAHDITADRSPITGGIEPEALRNAGARSSTWRWCTQMARSGRRTCSTATIRRSSCSARTAPTCLVTSRAWP
jgi:hypothetical protein